MHSIVALMTGRTAQLGDGPATSGIAKQAVHRALWLTPEGLYGDEQGDRLYHGGPEKALHHYALEHYPVWLNAFADCGESGSAPAPLRAPGAFGENIATLGLNERNVHIGDVYRIGSALVQVSQGRQPCWKLNLRFRHPGAARTVQQSGLTGWYYRVLRPGWVDPGAMLELHGREHEDWPLARLIAALFLLPSAHNVDSGQGPGQCQYQYQYQDRDQDAWRAEWQAAAGLAALAEGWRANFRQRIARGIVEDWSRRLDTPAGF